MNPDAASPLDSLRIASPCTADWSKMVGNDRTRFCADCRLNVHNLSAMTRDQAEELLRAAGQGRLCVRFHRRADGTVLTQDCPKGLRRRMRQMAMRAAALVAAFWSSVACARQDAGATGSAGPTGSTSTPLQGEPLPPKQGEVLMGEMIAPEPADAPEMGKRIVPSTEQPKQR